MMVIGIVAALAILAGSLVMLTINVQGNSSRDRQAKKSFNVSEAALDTALFKLGSSWPVASSPADWTAAEQQEFRDQFDDERLPEPEDGVFQLDGLLRQLWRPTTMA